MGRPEILLAVPQDPGTGALDRVIGTISDCRKHRFLPPPLLYTCIEEIDEKLGTINCDALFDTILILLLPEQKCWMGYAGGMSLTLNGDLHRSPLLELMCRYPEVYVVLVRHPGDATNADGYKQLLATPHVSWENHVVGNDSHGMGTLASLIENHGNGFRTLFDPTGIRSAARWYLIDKPTKAELLAPITAISIEDEPGFALFNGYALFRRGFSTYLASTLAETKRVLVDPQIAVNAVIEDLFLNFRDGDDKTLRLGGMLPNDGEYPEGLLKRRMAAYPKLAALSDTFYHLVISAGVPEHPDFDALWMTKPYGGMFAEEIERTAETIKNLRRSSSRSRASKAGHRHGMPGALHALSEDLVRRAGTALSDGAVGWSAAAAVHAAVLALEARRCLVDSRSSLDLTALSLQHRAEVRADCMFIGTTTDKQARKRLADLERSVEHILNAHDAGSSTAAEYRIQRLDALMHIATELSSIYDVSGQFDEAELFRQSVLSYQLAIQIARSASLHEPVSVKRLLGLPAIGFKYYIGTLLRSGWNIALFSLFWIVLFGAVYLWGAPARLSLGSAAQSWLASGFFFVTGNSLPIAGPAINPTLFAIGRSGQIAYLSVVFLNCLCGFVHLGIFIAYLYSKVARK